MIKKQDLIQLVLKIAILAAIAIPSVIERYWWNNDSINFELYLYSTIQLFHFLTTVAFPVLSIAIIVDLVLFFMNKEKSI